MGLSPSIQPIAPPILGDPIAAPAPVPSPAAIDRRELRKAYVHLHISLVAYGLGLLPVREVARSINQLRRLHGLPRLGTNLLGAWLGE